MSIIAAIDHRSASRLEPEPDNVSTYFSGERAPHSFIDPSASSAPDFDWHAPGRRSVVVT